MKNRLKVEISHQEECSMKNPPSQEQIKRWLAMDMISKMEFSEIEKVFHFKRNENRPGFYEITAELNTPDEGDDLMIRP